ncbi:MAG: helix-turn-helix domain-containing protein [Gordonia sp. (in: high G+C Gram-positive bacteria)]|uniref:helix-turn-helix domain-containing protein n=1 Tax=Gordonia sp. (in: high G+C Gram-positive bacteria) TaxID=84139 RepID=UPI003BB533AD
MNDDPRGILYPQDLPRFTRRPAPDDLADRVRWFWIPRWNLPPGRVSRQHLLPFPATNLVVDPADVTRAGPTTGASYRNLSGCGWAVGASLRPAGLASLFPLPQPNPPPDLVPLPEPPLLPELVEGSPPGPSALRDSEITVDFPDLHLAVSSTLDPAQDSTIDDAVAAFAAWGREHLATPDEAGSLANTMEELIATDRDLVRVEQLAERLAVSIRTVQRLAKRHIGLPPLAVIRRYRLQEAAQRVRDDPALPIAQIAAELGYADHAHLDADFRSVLGFTPATYRSGRS